MIDKQANQRKFEIRKRISMIGDVFLRKKSNIYLLIN